MKNKKKLIIIGAAVLAVILIIVVISAALKKSGKKTAGVSDYTVSVRDIQNVISGKATIKAKDQYEVKTLLSGDVIAAPFEEGDYVNKGDVLYKVDATDVENSVRSAELALQRAQISYDEAVRTQNDLTVRASVAGKIKSVNVKQGDSVRVGDVIAYVYSDSAMKLKVPFNENDALKIHIGDSARVMLSGGGELYGTVSEITSVSEVYGGYALVRFVTVTVQNPGTVTPNEKASVFVGNMACNDLGTFEYTADKSIVAKAAGDVSYINVREGSTVYQNQPIVTLKSDSINTQIQNASIALEDAQLSLKRARENLDDYTITAPISGTIISKDVKAGDVLDNTTANTVLAIIYDMSLLEFDMDVDEIEVNKVSVGKEVLVSVDAVSDKTYHALIDKVGKNGTTENGVTTYPVTIILTDADDLLLPGMNVDAKIVAEERTGVTAVPVGAVERDSVVYVKGKKTDKNDKAPDGYKTVKVETGISDENFVEIIKGIKEGDVVRVTAQGGSGTLMQSLMGGHMSGGASMGGGAPMGGGGAPMGGGGGKQQ